MTTITTQHGIYYSSEHFPLMEDIADCPEYEGRKPAYGLRGQYGLLDARVDSLNIFSLFLRDLPRLELPLTSWHILFLFSGRRFADSFAPIVALRHLTQFLLFLDFCESNPACERFSFPDFPCSIDWLSLSRIQRKNHYLNTAPHHGRACKELQ